MPYGEALMRFRKSACLLALFIAAQGCDCNRTSAQIQARHVMVATVLATPEISFRREAIAGFDFDASIPFFDGGFPFAFDGGCPFDGGCSFDAGNIPLDFDGERVSLKPQTALFVFFGQREGDGLTAPPVPVDGAAVKASNGARELMLDSQGSGVHSLTSQDDPTLVYDAGIDWTFTATSSGADFIGVLRDTPEPERITQLHPPEGYIDLSAGAQYQLTRADPEPAEQRLLGFVTVLPISASGQQGNPTYTNVPTTPLEFLKLVAAPTEWRSSVVTLPGTAFPEPDKNYLIVLQSAQLGFASSSNLFIGSAMIAGVADVGIVKTRK